MNISDYAPAKYYYECHITIEPVYGDRLEIARKLAESHSFRVADLLMQKRAEDTPERSKHDTFMTGRQKHYGILYARMVNLISALKLAGFKVWRYKIEDTIIDSKFEDNLFLL